jgi:nitrous oxidase accessory protein NosD
MPSGTPAPGGTPPRPAARPGGRPNAGNTGVPAGVTLTAVSGDQTYATAGQVIDGMDIRGYVRITARNVTIRNSIVRGGGSRCSAAVITIVAGASATIEDTEINPTNPNACLDGIWATAATLTRLNIHDTVDGVRAGNDVIVQDSWIHDLRHYTSGAPTGGGTETDAVQTISARRVTLRNNVLNPGVRGNAAYQVTQDSGPSGDLRVENNYLDGGHCTLNFSHRGSTTDLTGITVSGNRFGRNTTYVCPILLSTRTTLSRNSGNVWEDTSAPIPPPDRHD